MRDFRFFFLILSTLLISCNGSSDEQSNEFDKPHDPNKAVIVEGIGPKKGGLGTKVIVSGHNFVNDKEMVIIFFNEK